MLIENNFDVIIGGSGISGLLIASELSKTQSVLLIDSKNELQTNKFWVTLKSCVDVNPHLKPYVDSYFNSMDFSDAYQNLFTLHGEYILWDTVILMNFLLDEILKNGGAVKFDQRFCGYKIEKNGIKIFANDTCYSAKLFIDCMGYSSPLVLAKDLIQFSGHYLLYGAKLKLRDSINPVCLSNVILHNKPKYFEVFPTSKGEAFATIIYPTKSITDMKDLASDFKFITTKSPYAKFFEKDIIISKLWGIVPVGNTRCKALDKIYFFGESAQSNPAATGTCLTRLLLNYKQVAEFLNKKINENELSGKSLSDSPVILNPFIRKLQLYAFHDILSWNSDRFSKFINIINHVDHQIINKFIFGDLTLNDVITKNHLKALLKRKNFFLAKPLIKSIAKII